MAQDDSRSDLSTADILPVIFSNLPTIYSSSSSSSSLLCREVVTNNNKKCSRRRLLLLRKDHQHHHHHQISPDDLPLEILQSIQKLLPIDDFVRFSAVCTSWLAAARENPRPFSGGMPWLFVPSLKPKNLKVMWFPPNNDRPFNTFRIPIPHHRHLHGILSCAGHGLIAAYASPSSSSSKYLTNSDILLLNPFSSWKQIHRLPPTNYLGKTGRLSRVITDGSSSVTLALTSLPLNFYLAYTRIGSDDDDDDHRCWHDLGKEIMTRMAHRWGSHRRYCVPLDDIVSYKDGFFFAVAEDGTVLALDFSSSSSSSSDVVVTDVTFNFRSDYVLYGRYKVSLHLVVSSSSSSDDRNLFLVASKLLKRGQMMARNVSVYKLMAAENKWVSVKSLDGCSFFFGHRSQSLSLSSADFPELRTDCIYFPYYDHYMYKDVPDRNKYTACRYDDKDEKYTPYPDFKRNLIYNLKDGSWEQHYGLKDKDYKHLAGNMWWITPRLASKY